MRFRFFAIACAALLCGGTALAQDDGGFTALLNDARARRGLAPVAYDPGLAASASGNNAAQCARGMGHFVSCGTGQCAAVAWDAATALAQWAASGPHAAILFDPAATSCGFSCGGGYATANVGGAGAGYSVATWSYRARPARRGPFGLFRCRR